MLRRQLLILVLLFLAAAFDVALAADEIHFTLTGQTSVTFDWRGPDSTLRYGTTSAYNRTVTGSTPNPLPFSSAGPFWESRLTGLVENTLYHYSVGGGPDHTFHTPIPRGSSGFVIYAEGDIGNATNWPRMGAIQSMIASGHPNFVLALGDLTYASPGGQDHVDRHFNDVMAWSQDAAYMPIWGNHEWTSPADDDLRNYKGRFDLPNAQTSPGSPAVSCCGEDWYWFDYGNVRFIGYPEDWSGAWSDWGTRVAPVMAQAQGDPAIRFIVTFGHRPAYSSGLHSGSSSLKTILDSMGANYSKYVLNLNGHSHDYERSYPQFGVTHITASPGGVNLEQSSPPCLWPGGCPPPSWSAFRAMHHVAVRLEFGASGIRGTVFCGPAGDTGSNLNDLTCTQGAVLDSFTIGDGPPPPPVNQPPVVDAGSNQTITLPASANLSGTASDDGLPKPPGALTTVWSFGSGPGQVSFQNRNALNTQASFTLAGTYRLRLTASDGVLSATDSVQITVQPSGSVNTAPTVNAGNDQTITLPAPASLSGIAVDDGLPNPPGKLTTTWSAVSGPGLVSFQNPNGLSTQASFATAGVYVLRLAASDGALTTADSAQITVLPVPPQGTVTFERRIATGNDDAEENAAGRVSLNSPNLDLVFDKDNQVVGVRFTNLTIPRHVTVTRCYVQFVAKDVQSEVTNLVIQAQADDNAATFDNITGNVSDRPRTAAAASWSPPAWTRVGDAGDAERTPDLSALVTEVVARPGWGSGNALVFIFTGTGHRTAWACEGKAASPALLHMEYTSVATITLHKPVARPKTDELSLSVAPPGVADEPLRVEFDLAADPTATLEVMDVTGRCLLSQDVGSLGPGHHEMALREALPAGIYLVRLTQAGTMRVRKAVVLR